MAPKVLLLSALLACNHALRSTQHKLFEEMFCIKKKKKRNAALQPALHGKADLFASPLLLRASSVEVQP